MSARDAIEEHIAAFNAHDSTRVLAAFASDAVWMTGADTFTGASELAELFDDGLWALAPHLDVLSLIVDGARAAAQLRETLTVDGDRRVFDIAVFFELAGGLIARAKVYREGSAEV